MTDRPDPNAVHTRELDFQSPGADCSPAVYWFWHHIPSKDEIHSQLHEIAAAGYRTFLIQARLAFPLADFLSEDYLDAYRESMKVARGLGLTAGLYDDYNWMSGHGGGQTVRDHDRLRERQLFWTSADLQGGRADCSVSGIRSLMVEGMGEPGFNWCYEGGMIRWSGWEIFSALAYPKEGAQFDAVLDVTRYCALVEAGQDRCRVAAALPDSVPDDWRLTVFVAARCATSRHINYLLPEAAQRFIEVAYEPFRRTMPEYLGDPLAFAFFDHPHAGFYRWSELEGGLGNSLMFDESLVETFRSKYGYPMEHALLACIRPSSDQSPRLRTDFFESYGHQSRESFFGVLSEWTKANGIALSGHEVLSFIGRWGFIGGFGGIDPRTNFGADYFALDSYRAITAVDAYNNHPQISTRMGASTARSNGRRGCIVEQYYVSNSDERPGFVGQWDLTLDDMRAQAIRHVLFGARQFCYHGFYLTDGDDGDYSPLLNARWDFAPGLNYEPWFDKHAEFAAELSRLSAFIQSAEPWNDWAVLYPLRTLWAEGPGHLLGDESAFWNQWLSEKGYGYDIIDETEILKAVVSADCLAVGDRRYRGLILPGATTLFSVQTVEKLEAFVGAGGLLIASGVLPTASQARGRDPELERRVLDIFNELQNTLFLPGTAGAAANADRLRQFESDRFPASPEILWDGPASAPVWMWAGRDGTEVLLGLFNDARVQRRIRLEVPGGRYVPHRWDPGTGTTSTWGWFDWGAADTSVRIDLPPMGLTCLRLAPAAEGELPRLQASTDSVSEAVIDSEGGLSVKLFRRAGDPGWIEIASTEPPAVVRSAEANSVQEAGARRWRVEFGSRTMPAQVDLSEGWTFQTGDAAQAAGIDIRIGWERQGYPAFSGAAVYACSFGLPDADPGWDWELVFERVETAMDVYLNGELAGSRAWSPYALMLPGRLLLAAQNRLEVRVSNTAGNRYYHGTPYEGSEPTPSGIIGAPRIRPVSIVQVRA